MILNLLHRPGEGPFELQQEIAHSFNLKVTLMLRAKDLFDQATLDTAIKHHQQYGDEIGLWFMAFDCPEFDRVIGGQEELIWLRLKEDKQRIFDFLMGRFYEPVHQTYIPSKNTRSAQSGSGAFLIPRRECSAAGRSAPRH